LLKNDNRAVVAWGLPESESKVEKRKNFEVMAGSGFESHTLLLIAQKIQQPAADWWLFY